MPGSRREAALVRRALRGDDGAVEEIFARCWPLARRAALAVTGDAHLADEVAQDAFETMLRRLREFRGESALSTWLVRVVVNRARNVMRAEARSTPMADPPERGAEIAVAGDPELRAAVRALPAERREVVALRFWLDMSPPEIAAALEIPVGTVHSRLSRGLEELRARLEVSLERA
jgi:RNA polymerase sigma-70 factor (ECF subfamily)